MTDSEMRDELNKIMQDEYDAMKDSDKRLKSAAQKSGTKKDKKDTKRSVFDQLTEHENRKNGHSLTQTKAKKGGKDKKDNKQVTEDKIDDSVEENVEKEEEAEE